jgi:methionyl-tRNA synthetase
MNSYTSLVLDVHIHELTIQQKVEQSAAKKGVDPQTFVDEVSVNFRDLLDLMNISNDAFIRTTQDHHKKAVQHLWSVLVEKGYIYLGTYEGWYSVRDECFYSESELVDGKAPTGADVEWVAKEASYFFKLSAFQDRLLEYYEQHPHFIAPNSRRNEVISFVSGGLRDLSVSRTSFRWGVPVPGDPDHVMYVWVDALTNYISALGYGLDDTQDNNDNMMSKFWPASLHIVGKDILRFHAVYWPALLMAADLPVPKRLFAHGWWTRDGEKISKSLGNVIDPVDLVNEVRDLMKRNLVLCDCVLPHQTSLTVVYYLLFVLLVRCRPNSLLSHGRSWVRERW